MRKIIAIGIFLVLVGVVFAATPVNAAIISIPQPDATYVAETEKIDLSGYIYGNSYSGITDGYMTVTFSSTMMKLGPVPTGWATWDSPPWTETANPHVLFETTDTSMTWILSKPTRIFGFELEPNAWNVFACTVDFYAGATLVGSITQNVDGYYGARLFAARSLGAPFDKVEISVPAGAGGFSVAQIRYSKPQIDQQQTQDFHFAGCYDKYWLGQSFKPGLSTLTSVKLYIMKSGAPPNPAILSIRSSLTGPDLTSIALPAAAFPISWDWIEFDLPDITVIPGNTYYLVLRTTGGTIYNCYIWSYGLVTPYTNGELWKSYSYGSWGSWQMGAWYDFCFKTYGF
jgi:hypothetical protein